MKSMIALFAVGVCLFVGTVGLPNPNVDLPPATNKKLLGFGVPEEVLVKWGPTLQTLFELFREEGAGSPRVHRELAKLVIQFLVDRGYIGYGYPAGEPFPSGNLKYVKYYDHVFMTDFKKIYSLVPYDESYADLVVSDEEAAVILRELTVIIVEGIVTLVTTKTHTSPQQAAALVNIIKDPAFFGL